MKTKSIHFIYVGDVLSFMSPKIFVNRDAFEQFVFDVVSVSLAPNITIMDYWDGGISVFMPTAVMLDNEEQPTVTECIANVPDKADEENANALDLLSIQNEIHQLERKASELKWYQFFKQMRLYEDLDALKHRIMSLEDFLNKALYWYIQYGFGSVADFRQIDKSSKNC